MTQASPTVLFYGQALVMLKDLADGYVGGVLKTNTDVEVKLKDILNRFEKGIGAPLTQYEPVADTEPPLSAKMNRFWGAVQHDIALMQSQVDITRSAAIFVHNLLATEIAKGAQLNGTARNKTKTLQLYSDAVGKNVFVFGDSFHNNDFIDTSKVPVGQQAALESGQFLTLGHVGGLVSLDKNASVAVLATSNGFAGNNQEVVNPVGAPTDSTGAPILTFVAESARANDLTKLLDDDPTTWFEYEAWHVGAVDKQTAQNFNFVYGVNDVNGTTYVDWSNGPPDGTLRLDLEFNLGSLQKVNQVSYIPFGLTDNVNLPVLVQSMELSTDGTNWTSVFPQNVWIGTDINLNTARIANNVLSGTAVWSFQEQFAQYVRLHLQQPNSIMRPLGHIFWVDKKNPNTRVAGPDPFFDSLEQFYRPSNSTTGNALQRREFFTAQRWAIGIRDVSISQVAYANQSLIVTKPIRIPGVVDRVTLDADVFIPPGFDPATSWVSFFVSPDDGLSWFQISRIHDDFLNLPEVIAFNDPTPPPFREPGVAYFNVSNDVTALRLKILLSRPDTLASSSPIVRSYQLKVAKR